MQLDPASTAVVVVDMQNDFCHPDGALYAEGSEEVISKVNDVVGYADDTGAVTVYTQDTHREGQYSDNRHYDEFEQWGVHCVEDTWGHELHEDVDIGRYSFLQQKSTYDAFHETELDTWLRSVNVSGIDTLVICGTLANVCVQETASTANLLDYDVKVVEDACGYITEEQRDAAMEHIDFLIGDVIETEDL